MKTILISFTKTRIEDLSQNGGKYITEAEALPVIYAGIAQNWDGWEKITDKVKNMVDESFDITSISTYYRFPKLNLSRDKMSLLKDSKGIKKVLDKDKADLWVVSQKYLKSMINFDYRTSLSSVQHLHSTLSKENLAHVSNEMREKLLDMCKDMDPDMPLLIRDNLGYYSSHHSTNGDTQALITSLKMEATSYNSYIGYISSENIEAWESITESSKFIVEDSVMNNIASNDAVVIDNEIYCSIVKMLKGSNEDRTVAMSTMSNCNISKSVGYLALLFFHFNDTLKQNLSWNHVAFKGLKDQFSEYAIEYGHYSESRYSIFIERLAKEDALTVEILNHITHLMFDRVLASAFGHNGTSIFRLKNIDIDIVDKCKDKVVDPYTTLITAPTYALPF
jgi:hypothetical protein